VLLSWAFLLVAALTRAVPLRLAYAAGGACGTLAYYSWPGGRRRCIANMRHVVGPDETQARRTARRSFANYGRYMVDFLRFSSDDLDMLAARLQYDGWETLARERAEHGVLYVTMHIGNWDAPAAAFAQRGIPIATVVDTFSNRHLNAMVLDSRRHLGMQLIPAERMGPSILRALLHRDVVAILIDVPPAGPGVEVEFFGGTIAVPDGPARLALRAGATVIASIVPREHPSSERVIAETAVVRFTPSGDNEHDVHALTQAIMRALEPMVRRHPEQWYIFRSLWLADRARS
jgi:KDO2-lipid IV(A) lauroyltransferase